MTKIIVLLHEGRIQSNLTRLYCIEYRFFIYISLAFLRHIISQTEAFSVGFSSKVRFKKRETKKERAKRIHVDERRRAGRQFQKEGPIDVTDLVLAMVIMTQGRKRSWRREAQRGRREEEERVSLM